MRGERREEVGGREEEGGWRVEGERGEGERREEGGGREDSFLAATFSEILLKVCHVTCTLARM